MTRTTRTLAGLTIGLVAAAGGVLAPVAVPAAEAAGDCSGVWVVVGGQGTKCATSHATGKDALKSAGFSVRDKTPGFLCQIGGVPSTCTITEDAHWAYWQASRKADGTWGPWRYSQLGYTSTSPKKGDAEGWVFGAGMYGPTPPAPPAAPKPAPAPTSTAPAPAPTSKAPAPAPTSKAPAPAPTSKAAAPTKAPATKAPASKATAAPAASKAAPAPASAEPTPEVVAAEPTPVEATPTPAEPTAAEATVTVGPTPAPTATATVEDGSGSPVGTLVTGGVLLAGGGALGGWWLLRRRGV